MRLPLVLGLCLLLTQTAIAQPKARPPEALLPRDCLFFLRYDGYEPHKKAYDQTALARIMEEDLGDFLAEFGAYLFRQAVAGMERDNADPGLGARLEAHGKIFLDYFWKHGVAVGFQTPRHIAPLLQRWNLTLVFPEGGKGPNRGAIVSFLQLLATKDSPVRERKWEGRTLFETGTFAWWVEGEHLVFCFANDDLDAVLDVSAGRRPGLIDSKLYSQLAGFKNYETDIRGFLDLEQVLGLLMTPSETKDKLAMAGEVLMRQAILNQLGLTGLKNCSFHLGFAGKYQRSTINVGVVEPKERRGLLKLITGPVSIDPKDVPALPPDLSFVTVRHADWEGILDFVLHTYRLLSLVGNRNNFLDLPEDLVAQASKLLGADFRKDLIGTLDNTYALYHAWSEGPIFLGMGLAIKVKDAKKLQDTLDKMNKGLREATRPAGGKEEEGVNFQVKKYRGADLHVLTSGMAEDRFLNFFLPVTYTIHKGWLVVGLFPQSVKGYLMRCEGKYRRFEMPELARTALAEAMKTGTKDTTLMALTVTDPRPNLEIALSLAPLFFKFIGSGFFGGGGKNPFDVEKVPNAQAVTEHLFPDVTLFLDDGTAFRWENHYALDVPDWWSFLGFSLLGYGF